MKSRDYYSLQNQIKNLITTFIIFIIDTEQYKYNLNCGVLTKQKVKQVVYSYIKKITPCITIYKHRKTYKIKG